MTMRAVEPQVLLIDQNAFRRASYLSLLENWAQSLNVSVKAVKPDAAETELEKLSGCHLVLLNLGSQSIDEDGMRQLMKLLCALIPDTPLAIISDNTDPREVASAFRSGASGFIPTDLDPSVALQSFIFIMKGGAYFPPSALLQKIELQDCHNDTDGSHFGDGEAEDEETEGRTLYNGKRHGKSRILGLTTRQHQVLEQLRYGKSNKVIADALNMTEATVKLQVHQIMRKLGAANRTQAAVHAVEAGMNGTLGTNGSGGSVDVKCKHELHSSQGLHTKVVDSA